MPLRKGGKYGMRWERPRRKMGAKTRRSPRPSLYPRGKKKLIHWGKSKKKKRSGSPFIKGFKNQTKRQEVPIKSGPRKIKFY